MKIFYLFVIFILTIIILSLPYIKPETVPIFPEYNIQSENKIEIPELLKQINLRNNGITSFSSKHVTMKIWSQGLRFRLTGSLYYEKINHFRMMFSSVFGKETDFGSNDNIFWYWSKRDPEEGLYYAEHEDCYKTNLKTAFNPIFIKSSLGLDVIPLENAKISETNEEIIVINEEKTAAEGDVLRITFVSKSGLINGFLLCNLQQEAIASCKIEYSGKIPSRIMYYLHNENKVMSLEFENCEINSGIDSNFWLVPDYKPKIDLAK